MCARGGAGAGGLLPLLDPALVRAHPKALLGCSDITFLHLFLDRLDLVSLHGPMAAGDLGLGSLRPGEPPPRRSSARASPTRPTPDASTTLARRRGRGRAAGRLPLDPGLGGGHSLGPSPRPAKARSSSSRTSTSGPYRIDRMLRQLRQAGAFAGLRGIVFGDMKGCAPKADEGYTLEAVILDALEGLSVPVALGLSSGHTANPAVTLPLGARARLSCTSASARFEVLEPALA